MGSDGLHGTCGKELKPSGIHRRLSSDCVERESTLPSTVFNWGRDSSVGITTRYGLDGPWIESLWGGEIFRTRPDQPWGPTQLPIRWVTGLFSGGKAAGAWH